MYKILEDSIKCRRRYYKIYKNMTKFGIRLN